MGYRRKSRLNRKMSRRRIRSSWRASGFAPILKIGGIVLAVGAFACLIIFLIIPIFSGKMNKEEPKPTPTLTRAFRDPNEIADISNLEKEATPLQKSINSPYIFGSEMVYSTGEKSNPNPPLKAVAIYDLEKNETQAELSGLTCKYSNLFEPKMSENYIVLLDVNSKGGGRILGYDRKAGKMFVIREYFYGMPKLRLSGDYVAWMQQTHNSSDRLYMCHLPTNETVCLGVFVDTPASFSGVDICESELIWVEKAGDEEASEDMKCVVKRLALSEGKGSEPTTYDPEMFVFDPFTDGKNIVFLDSPRGAKSRLMLSIGGGKPKVLETGVLNYGMGDGFVVYTKDETIYTYFIGSGLKAKLNRKNTRGELATVCGDMVCWYDVTDGGLVRDVIKYAQVAEPAVY